MLTLTSTVVFTQDKKIKMEKDKLLSEGARQAAADLIELRNTYEVANQHVIDIQDSKEFQDYLKEYDIEFNDSTPEYWDAVSDFAHLYIKDGLSGESTSMNQIILLSASAPSMVFNQYFLSEGEEFHKEQKKFGKHEFLYTKEVHEMQVARVSRFNQTTRDYLGDNLDTDYDTFSRFLVDAANLGADIGNDAYNFINMALVGIRTELGFEQKAAAAGLKVKRGEGLDDISGVDYRVDDVPIDVKTSLNSVKESSESDETKAWAKKGRRIVYYPYIRPEDFKDKTFRVLDDVLASQAEQIKSDIRDMKKALNN